MKIGLVLEGGGMRGLYTVGILDAMLDHHIAADYVIGVSAGACHGVSYVSCQRGRAYRVNTDYLKGGQYLSLSNYVKTGSFFGMDFLFKEIPERLEPFDYDTFFSSPTEYVAGVTDVRTGRAVYFSKEALNHDTTVLRASSSIPVFSPAVPFREGLYLDGGAADPIPVRKALEDGCDKVIVVLTRQRDYIKRQESIRAVYQWAFREYPAMMGTLSRRHEIYNETRRYVGELAGAKTAFLLYPKNLLGVDRFEKDKDKLKAVYEQGYEDLINKLSPLKAFMRVD